MAKKKTNEQDIPLFQGIDVDQIHPVETITEEQAEKYKFDTVDFSDPNRPNTCLEVDFPILKVNEISAIEQNATKPIYMMSKWWARRRASVFRQLLISAATKAPVDESKAAQISWSQMYRKNHQGHGVFKNLKVLDIFMGGGTTLVEASRLGFDITGVDLNPIAWWVVKNETNPVEPKKIKELYKYIEGKVKPQIAPFYTANSPWGFKGTWKDVKTKKELSADVYKMSPEERLNIQWEGPELVCTFWVSHVICSDPVCNHLTPLLNTSVAAVKSLKIKFLKDCVCTECGDIFDIEYGRFRMAPTAKFVLGENEKKFISVQEDIKNYKCPHCNAKIEQSWISKQEEKKKAESKAVSHTLLLSKKWMNGISAKNKDSFGGYYGSSEEQDKLWFEERSKNLDYIEVRGDVPETYVYSNFGQKSKADSKNSRSSTGKLICGGCGRHDDPLNAIKISGKMARVFPYLIQGFDPVAADRKYPYNGRFFDRPDFHQISTCFKELSTRNDIKNYIPNEELFYGFRTYWQSGGLTNRGISHWYKMFNPRQLYTNALLIKEIMNAPSDDYNTMAKSQILGGWQNYLRHNCMFTIWNTQRDTLEPHFANNNYHPKNTTVENSVFSNIGRGNFASCVANVVKGMEFAKNPYDLKVNTVDGKGGKSLQVSSTDKIESKNVTLYCQSSTDLKNNVPNESIDLVITDPPFGDNLDYSELADFFLVWLWKPLTTLFPELSCAAESPKSLEAVANPARWKGEDEHGVRKADIMYDRLLTLCWKEAFRVLKPGGMLAFTFHHDKDIAWIGVLESLFKAGFRIESTFPIRSDSAKGNQDFGTKKIEFDIVHVCRKTLTQPEEIYWATLRRKIVESVKSKSLLLAQHRASGLHLADLEVIIRGEVLEQYSKYFGKVKKNLAGDLLSVKEILLEANVIAQAMLQKTDSEKIPDGIDVNTRVLFTLFREGPSIEFNAARLRLKGSGVILEELQSQGWITIIKESGEKLVKLENISERWSSLSRKKTINSDLDQVHFVINCCLGNKQLDGKNADLELWIESNYKIIFPTVIPILKYVETNHFGADYKQAIGMAYRTLERTLNKIKESDGEFRKVSDQLTLF